jgi:hypothetical protein
MGLLTDATRQTKGNGKQKRPGKLRAVAKSRPADYQLPIGELIFAPLTTLVPPLICRNSAGLISVNVGLGFEAIASRFEPNKTLIKETRLNSIMSILLRRLNQVMSCWYVLQQRKPCRVTVSSYRVDREYSRRFNE